MVGDFIRFGLLGHLGRFSRFSQTSVTSSQTCPLCREDMTSDSGFLLAETPKYDHVKKTLAESILSLPVDYKTRSNDGHSSLRHPRE